MIIIVIGYRCRTIWVRIEVIGMNAGRSSNFCDPQKQANKKLKCIGQEMFLPFFVFDRFSFVVT